MNPMTLFGEIALVVVMAAAFGFVAHLLKQPTIIGYLFAGLLIGPLGLINFSGTDVLGVLSEIGIALLLFMVGLEINPKMTAKDLREFGKPAILTGLGQIIFTVIAGFFLTRALGFGTLAALYISTALTFSSTIIVVQLLSQKRDLGSLYGKIVIGFLLVQDFFAILALIFLSGLSGTGENASLLDSILKLFLAFAKGGVLLIITAYLSKKFFPKLLDLIGRSQELLFLFSMGWGLGLAALMASPWIGFSIEIGGFLAGLALASSITHFQIAGRVKPVRDFFIMLFFVSLGAGLVLENMQMVIAKGLILSLFVLIGNPLIVMFIMSGLGYRARTSFLASLTVAQISEFSLILAALGMRLGHLTATETALITFVGIVTITVSSYFILYGDKIYKFLRRPLKLFEFRRGVAEVLGEQVHYANHIVLIGAHRMGGNVLAALKALDEPYIVVDFDPFVVERLSKKGEAVLYGDISDDEIKELASLRRARAVISTVPDPNDSRALIAYLKKENPHCIIILAADTEWEAKEFYALGASYVILPHFVGGLQIAQAIKDDPELEHLKALKSHDLAILRE